MSTSQTRPYHRLCGLLLGAAALVACPALAQGAPADEAAAPDNATRIQETRAALAEWRKVRDVISQERRDWTLRRQVLADRIALMKTQIEQVQQQIAEREEELAGFDTKIGELEQTNTKLTEASEALAEAVTEMETRTVELLQQVPGPLREQVRPLAVQLPGYTSGDAPTIEANQDEATTNGETALPDQGGEDVGVNEADIAEDEKNNEGDKPRQVPLAQRFQNVIGVLNMVNKFNGVITVASETQEQSDGSVISVTAMYLGLGQGFYVDREGAVAAVGAPDAGRWGWTPADASAAQIKLAVDVFNSEQPASFVGLPVEVK